MYGGDGGRGGVGDKVGGEGGGNIEVGEEGVNGSDGGVIWLLVLFVEVFVWRKKSI